VYETSGQSIGQSSGVGRVVSTIETLTNDPIVREFGCCDGGNSARRASISPTKQNTLPLPSEQFCAYWGVMLAYFC
jgi:hypothetical protein